jgi:hypothetical protein
MAKANLRPMNWNDLPDIEDLEPASEEESCLAEVQEVLERHGKAGRFGIVLLHKHFELADDEVMMETWDPSTRTLTSRPVSVEDLAGKAIRPTTWRFDRPGMPVVGACAMGMYGGHYGYKDD